MKLDLNKSEKKTMFGKTKYVVTARITLAEDEAALVKKHMKDWAILDREGVDTLSPDAALKLVKKAGHLLDFYTRYTFEFEFDTIQDLGNYEAALIRGCKHLKQQLEAVQSHAEAVGSSTSLEF
ncbi:MAG: hypothetical protein U0704_11970 [Candidatus Eisenbacteria bacterium]